MKVILLTDLKGRGSEGDVIEVARGFAVNYLLPRKMAVEATPGNLKQLEARKHNIAKREAERRAEAERVAAAIAGKTIVVEAKAGDEGKLFGSVTAGMVAEAMNAQLGVDLDRRKFDMHTHIKTLGDYPVTAHLYADVEAEVVVRVVRTGEGAAAIAEAAASSGTDQETAVEADEATEEQAAAE
ncbi:MAG: 50S ribosomal protein L9 [Anaerosomatales bacterium]|nr:50S ribosomal protein L9 [Coriobacteriia bacterium]MDI6691997.1 50S ribosomal protein L9 [Anaerosomatales bacterium]